MSINQQLLHLTLLYDFYSGLLTEKQRSFFEMYHFQDLSLGEISTELNITAQAVRDLIKRTENNLMDYEKRLGLLENHQRLKQRAAALMEMAEGFSGLTNAERGALEKGIADLIE